MLHFGCSSRVHREFLRQRQPGAALVGQEAGGGFVEGVATMVFKSYVIHYLVARCYLCISLAAEGTGSNAPPLSSLPFSSLKRMQQPQPSG